MFDDYPSMKKAVDDPNLEVTADHVLVLRNAGPQDGPGMPEWGMLPMPKKLLQEGHRDMLRMSDARLSGTFYGACVHEAVDQADLIITIGHDTIERPPFIMGPNGPKVVHVSDTPANVDQVHCPHAEVVGDLGPSLELLADRRVLFFSAPYFTMAAPSVALSLRLPRIVTGFSGASIPMVGVLSAIPFAFGVVAMPLWSLVSDRRRAAADGAAPARSPARKEA